MTIPDHRTPGGERFRDRPSERFSKAREIDDHVEIAISVGRIDHVTAEMKIGGERLPALALFSRYGGLRPDEMEMQRRQRLFGGARELEKIEHAFL